MKTRRIEISGDEWSASRPCRFIPEERIPGNHYVPGSVGLHLYSTAAQPAERRCTDWAIWTLIILLDNIKIRNSKRILSCNLECFLYGFLNMRSCHTCMPMAGLESVYRPSHRMPGSAVSRQDTAKLQQTIHRAVRGLRQPLTMPRY
jgi:hypothetical protein